MTSGEAFSAERSSKVIRGLMELKQDCNADQKMASLCSKYLNTVTSLTSASLAISRVVVPWKPWRENKATAALIILDWTSGGLDVTMS
jgi:hypothetical protein